ncbi:ABC transporter substrate-binding protein [Isoptericola cucumis]|uniref:Sugar ABC transporter substrate-binding protein n=1 Tax=Isoptericola cucumis TaxID=1776856 RepID=A0ABQ2BCN4_9MICO|nr:sugar ABC transporter substrate-binding protein [Isoptericola cucumis]GGI11517.1 sugar ABC transporter substrate-binding protein [Isoptericola cucumis]
MRRSFPRRAALGGTAAATVLALGACGIAGGSGGTDDAAAADGEVTGEITFQTWNLKGGYEDYFTDLIAAFEEEHPGATVKWVDQPAEGYEDSLSADAAAGNLPDVVDMGPEAAYTLASADMLLDVAAADPEAKAGYLPQAWDAMTFDGLGGGTYGFPWYLNTGPSFFNTELLEKCGLDADNLPSTYDELFDQATTMAAECDDATMIGRLPEMEVFGSFGSQLMNDDQSAFTFNDAKGVELVQRYADLYAEGGFTAEAVNALQTEELEAFKAGQVAWLPGSSYTLKELKDTAPEVYKNVEVVPAIANTAPNMYLESLAVSSQSDNTPTAIAFARFVTGAENQMSFAKEASVFPSAEGSLDDPFFTEDDGTDDARVRVQAAKQVGEAQVWVPPTFSEASSVFLHEQIAQAVLGKKTAQEALDATVAYSDERIAGSE